MRHIPGPCSLDEATGQVTGLWVLQNNVNKEVSDFFPLEERTLHTGRDKACGLASDSVFRLAKHVAE